MLSLRDSLGDGGSTASRADVDSLLERLRFSTEDRAVASRLFTLCDPTGDDVADSRMFMVALALLSPGTSRQKLSRECCSRHAGGVATLTGIHPQFRSRCMNRVAQGEIARAFR